MECPECKRKLSAEEYNLISKKCGNLNLSLAFSPCFVIKNNEAFRAGISSLVNAKKPIVLFDAHRLKLDPMNRPVLLHALKRNSNNDNSSENTHRRSISLIEMKIDHFYKGRQLLLKTVTRPELTNLMDGTIYMIVRDELDHHVRLVVSNWSYAVPTNELNSTKSLSRSLDELLPVDSTIKLLDPLLTTCTIDNQHTLCCTAPNIQLILLDRQKNCFMFDKLDDLRDRGNQAYIRGDTQLAIDYYTSAIDRINTMAEMVSLNGSDAEIHWFQNAFEHDLARLHSNRSACFLREHLYSYASVDALSVVSDRFFDGTYDELFLKCLYRVMCATIGLQEFTFILDGLFELVKRCDIDLSLGSKHKSEFNEIQSEWPRMRKEHDKGTYDLKRMFAKESTEQTTFFDIPAFHSNFHNGTFIRKRNQRLYAKCFIPSGALLLVERAFTCVKSGHGDEQQLLNLVEKHLNMAPTAREFDRVRIMPSINHWFKNETDADESDHETYPKSMPYKVLVKTQQRNPFRSKSLIGWWPQASLFLPAVDLKQKQNCLWFICGETIFVFSSMSIEKNNELIIADANRIGLFLKANQNKFTFLLGEKDQVRLGEIFHLLQKTQIYF